MKTAGIFEAKQNFSALVEAVEAGEEVRITRHGREVARLLPMPSPATRAREGRGAAAVQDLQRLRSQVKPGPGWKELRDEGRRF